MPATKVKPNQPQVPGRIHERRTLDPQEWLTFLINSGLLFEINRTMLHPLGLAFQVTRDGHDNFELGGTIGNPEVCFPEPVYTKGDEKYKKYMKEHGHAAFAQRRQKLGFTRQEQPSIKEQMRLDKK